MEATLYEYFEKGVPYEEYMAAFRAAVEANRTSGPIQTEELVAYTKLNLTRSSRIEKHTVLSEEWNSFGYNGMPEIHAICITEFWCGDAAQNIPTIEKIAQGTQGKLKIRYVFRDENPELMDAYLTNGGRSIPKYILLDARTKQEVAMWGPRPQTGQDLLQKLKEKGVEKETLITEIQTWYNHDKTQSLQKEWIKLLHF